MQNTVNWESLMKTIKLICRPRFEIRLIETSSGTYRVCFTKNDQPEVVGEAVSDYSLAAIIFDMKFIELEGN